jgi:hypothetical protein
MKLKKRRFHRNQSHRHSPLNPCLYKSKPASEPLKKMQVLLFEYEEIDMDEVEEGLYEPALRMDLLFLQSRKRTDI